LGPYLWLVSLWCLLDAVSKVHQHAARISMRDIADLNQASEQLAAAADTIQRVNPAWGAGVVQLLIAANNVVVRVQQKGARAFAAWLEKHGVKELPSEAEIENAPDAPDQGGQNDSGEA
jgi:formylglycine-generating enzyme required for sulfatase activity